MKRHPYIVTMHAYLDDIRSTVGQATLRERESKLLYLFEVMLELRLSPDPRTVETAQAGLPPRDREGRRLVLGHRREACEPDGMEASDGLGGDRGILAHRAPAEGASSGGPEGS